MRDGYYAIGAVGGGRHVEEFFGENDGEVGTISEGDLIDEILH